MLMLRVLPQGLDARRRQRSRLSKRCRASSWRSMCTPSRSCHTASECELGAHGRGGIGYVRVYVLLLLGCGLNLTLQEVAAGLSF